MLRMKAASNVVILCKGEDITKLEDFQNSKLKEILKYQEDSSAFDSDDQKAILENMPKDLSAKQKKLVKGLFPAIRNDPQIIPDVEKSIAINKFSKKKIGFINRALSDSIS